MPVIRNSVILRCEPGVAFDYLSDLRAELEWNPKCESMVKLTEGPVGMGTRYRAKWKSSPHVDLETLAFDRPRSWTMHNGGPIEVTFTCRLETVPYGMAEIQHAPKVALPFVSRHDIAFDGGAPRNEKLYSFRIAVPDPNNLGSEHLE